MRPRLERSGGLGAQSQWRVSGSCNRTDLSLTKVRSPSLEGGLVGIRLEVEETVGVLSPGKKDQWQQTRGTGIKR